MRLEIEPVLRCNWGKSLANLLPKEVWDKLRREVYEAYDYKCCICGERGKKLHCHEVWTYNDKKKVQKLVNLECICGTCHALKHWGRTKAVTTDRKELQSLIDHFCKVNGCSEEVFYRHDKEISRLLGKRSTFKYKVDFGKLAPDRLISLCKV